MADVSDVMNALVALSAQAIYPNGTGQSSVSSSDVIVYAGWCNPQRLDADLLLGKAHISVYPRPEETLKDYYNPEWVDLSKETATLLLTVGTNTVTLSGTVTTGHNVALLVNDVESVYTCQSGDTLASIATALAVLTGGTSVGAVLTLNNPWSIVARVGVHGYSIRELRRQSRLFQIVIWSPTPALRDTLAKALDAYLTQRKNITLADGSIGLMKYKNSPMTDDLQKATIFRRDLMYTVEYPTTETIQTTAVTIATTVINNFKVNL